MVLDTCFSGQGVASATEVADAILALRPPAAQHVWVGVLASCLPWETARDGEFGRRLASLIEHGPTSVDLRRPWSVHNQFLRGDEIGRALLYEWDTDVQRPVFRQDGVAVDLIPNPLFEPDAAAVVVEHLLLAARGTGPGEELSWFTGRTGEVDTVVRWVTSGVPGLRVVTGSAGTGKSAIVGRVVSAAHRPERQRLLAQGSLGHADPGVASVAANVHARDGPPTSWLGSSISS